MLAHGDDAHVTDYFQELQQHILAFYMESLLLRGFIQSE
jgi:hypothetical protein